VASFCFVRFVKIEIDSEFIDSVGKLALKTVRTEILFHEVFTEGAFDFGIFWILNLDAQTGEISVHLIILVAFGGSFGLRIPYIISNF
jgi:hypothetical protein